MNFTQAFANAQKTRPIAMNLIILSVSTSDYNTFKKNNLRYLVNLELPKQGELI